MKASAWNFAMKLQHETMSLHFWEELSLYLCLKSFFLWYHRIVFHPKKWVEQPCNYLETTLFSIHFSSFASLLLIIWWLHLVKVNSTFSFYRKITNETNHSNKIPKTPGFVYSCWFDFLYMENETFNHVYC